MSCKKRAVSILVLLVVAAVSITQADEKKTAPPSVKIAPGSKVFVASMPDGFDTYLKTAMADKKVPLEIVASRDQADYEITGISDTQKASTAKEVIFGNWHSREEASINVIDIKSSEVVWSYSVHKESSAHGKKSTAEACAKHLKDEIASK